MFIPMYRIIYHKTKCLSLRYSVSSSTQQATLHKAYKPAVGITPDCIHIICLFGCSEHWIINVIFLSSQTPPLLMHFKDNNKCDTKRTFINNARRLLVSKWSANRNVYFTFGNPVS